MSIRVRYKEKLLAKIKEYESDLTKKCGQLSKERKETASILQEKIKAALSDLNFAYVDFEIAWSRKDTFGADGWDEAEFLIATNPGEPKKSLEKIASGGELSRIMLAIKSVFAEKDHIETLIFDEIDAGISGRTAQKVSEKMAVIARKHQVICITHLPQIAAMADDHYVIEKSAMEQRTITEIYHLSDDASVGEIARLLGGVEITEAVMQDAREMKILAQSKK